MNQMRPPPRPRRGPKSADGRAERNDNIRHKKVLLVGSHAPTLVNFRTPLISAIVARGHEVVAVASHMDAESAETLRQLGARSHELQLANQSLNPLAMWGAIDELRRLIRAETPDVVIAYTIKPILVAAMAASAERVPRLVSMITGAGYAFTPGGGVKRTMSRIAATQLYRVALPRSHAVVFQNPDDEAQFRQLGLIAAGQDVRLTNGSGVDLKHFAPTPLPKGASFLMMARFLKTKGIRDYAAAAARLKAAHPGVVVQLVGWADSSPDSISQAELGRIIDSGVLFRGRFSDVRPAISNCSVLVLPSYYREGVPRSVLEAMAMGRAIITTDSPGCRETVRDGVNGFLVPPRDPDALYAAMLRFVVEPGLAEQMGAASRKIAETKFDVDGVNAELLSVADL